MKTNKEQIYDILKLHFSEGGGEGASTQYLSELLGIQRTNVSAILNTLVAEGLVAKTNGRPVLYFATKEGAETGDCFANMVGHDGSLKRAVQLAQAAVLYPQGSLNALVTGQAGTGKKFLAMLMHRYAVENGVVLPDAPYHLADCRRFSGDNQMMEQIFGEEGRGGCYEATRRGVLVIDNLHLAGMAARNLLIERLAASEAEEGSAPPPHVILLCEGGHTAVEEFRKVLPVTIELPPLAERPMEERKSLIQNFLTLEAARARRVISINAELMRCLLLYDTDINIARLKYDIKLGCANAYVRERSLQPHVLNLYIGDFENHVRKGFLKYRLFRDEVEQIIPADYSYSFSETTFEMTAVDKDKLKGASLYSMIDQRASQLMARGLTDHDISLLLVAEIEPQFAKYHRELADKVINAEHLSRLVDEKVIRLVREFLLDASEKLGRTFPQSVFYGLCLHLDTTLKDGPHTEKMNMGEILTQMREIVENYRAEYSLAIQFSKQVEEEFGQVLSVDEVVLLTMFICFKTLPAERQEKPVVLYALHGAGVAKAMAGAVNAIVKVDNVYHYEIPFEDDFTAFYDGLCSYVKKIDKGCGIIVLYDMDYITKVFSMIYNETQIEMRLLPMPITNIGLEISRKAATDGDIDSVYQETIALLQNSLRANPPVIVTLCATGAGGAVQLQQYLQQHGNLRETKVVPMSMASRDKLKDDLADLMKDTVVQCIVGTFDPKLFGIPFLPVNEVFSAPPEELPALLRQARQAQAARGGEVDYGAVYRYLGEHLTHVSMPKLKKLLPMVIEEINADITPMTSDTQVGLFLHIPCCIERILSKGEMPVNIQKAQIINRYLDSYKKLIRILKPMEKTFGVIFNDDELAILLTIIYKL